MPARERRPEKPCRPPQLDRLGRGPRPATGGRVAAGDGTTARVSTRDGLWIAVVAFGVYVALGSDYWHGVDAPALLNQYRMGSVQHSYHVCYLPLLWLIDVATAPLGGNLYRAALTMSAAGAAIGVWCAHRAARILGADRGSAAFAAALVATAPSVVYFATIVEVHAPVLAFAGICWLAMAVWAARPGPVAASGCGLALALAFLAHPTAALLGLCIVPLAALHRANRALQQVVAGLAVALLVLLAGVWLLPWLVRAAGGAADAGFAFDYLGTRSRSAELANLPGVATREFLVPFLPLAIAMAALLAGARTRVLGLSILLANLPFVLVSWAMLLPSECEHGAYSAAAVGPSAIVVALHLRGRWLRSAALAVAGATAAVLMLGRAESPRHRDTAVAVASAAAGPFLWLTGDEVDLEVQLARFPAAEYETLGNLLSNPPELLEPALAAIERRVALAAGRGAPVLVTSNASNALARVGDRLPQAARLREWLLARRGSELARSGGVAVFEVRVEPASSGAAGASDERR